MRLGAIACACVACAAPASAPVPPRAQEVATPRPSRPAPPSPGLRIPRTFVPSAYRARLAIEDDATAFDGAIEIDGALAEAAPVVWLHADRLAFGRATATRGERTIELAAQVVEGEYVALVPERPLDAGAWTLRIAYRAAIANQEIGERTTDVTHGAFREVVGGEPYAFTMFEPMDARRVFPCIDEPDDKVPWQLTLDVRRDFVAASNTPIAREIVLDARRKRVAFQVTRPLPSYLVAFAVGPFEVVDAGAAGSGVAIRVLAQRGDGGKVAAAAGALPHVVDLIEDFVGIPYPYGKLDVVTVPQVSHRWGAMENAGLVTVSSYLATRGPKRWWVETMAHELAHHYFGDLVTPAWWNDIWLNEGFAVWTAEKIAARFDPSWLPERVMFRAGTAMIVRAPLADAQDRARLQTYFDGHHGAEVLRMIETFVGENTFRAGVRAYLDAHADRNATTADLVAALEAASGRKLDAIVADALDRSIPPEVTATLDCRGTPALRFASSDPAWTLPACVSFDRDGARVDACAVIAGGKADLPLDAKRCPRWILPNHDGITIYRTNWTPALATPVVERAWPAMTPRERAVALEAMQSSIDDDAFWLATALRLIDADDFTSRAVGARKLADLTPLVPDDLRPRFDAWIRRRFGARARAVHFLSMPDGSDLAVAEVALVATTDDRELAKEAVELVHRDALDARFRAAALRLAVRADVRVAETVLELTRTEVGWRHDEYVAALAAEGALLDWLAKHPRFAGLSASDRVALISDACSRPRRALAVAAARDFLELDRDRALDAIDQCIARRERLAPIFRRALSRL